MIKKLLLIFSLVFTLGLTWTPPATRIDDSIFNLSDVDTYNLYCSSDKLTYDLFATTPESTYPNNSLEDLFCVVTTVDSGGRESGFSNLAHILVGGEVAPLSTPMNFRIL